MTRLKKSCYFPGSIEKYKAKYQLGYPIFRPRFEPGPSGIYVYGVTAKNQT